MSRPFIVSLMDIAAGFLVLSHIRRFRMNIVTKTYKAL